MRTTIKTRRALGAVGALSALALALAPIAMAPTPAGAASSTLIPAGSTWRYLDNGSNQGTGWRATAFNDSSWAQGPAQFGYGDGDEATVVSFGPSATNKYRTTYFRRAVTVDTSTLNSVTLNPV